MALLEIDNVSKRFGGNLALAGVSFAAAAGESVGILGPNGSGKSTLFNVVSSLERPTGGSITFDGHRITGLAPHRVAALGVGRTFQSLRLFKDVTCLDNVMIGSHRFAERSLAAIVIGLARVGRSERSLREHASGLLERVGLSGFEGRFAANLSYGQMKRLELARALACRPRLLLLDEPTAGLNDTGATEMLGLARNLVSEQGITLLVVEHNVRALLAAVDRAIVLETGSLIFDGSTDAVLVSEVVRDAYLGDDQ
jgi:branched-chain amino acid transport system ATP-binding protein